jgi:hypothetical protein
VARVVSDSQRPRPLRRPRESTRRKRRVRQDNPLTWRDIVEAKAWELTVYGEVEDEALDNAVKFEELAPEI